MVYIISIHYDISQSHSSFFLALMLFYSFRPLRNDNLQTGFATDIKDKQVDILFKLKSSHWIYNIAFVFIFRLDSYRMID